VAVHRHQGRARRRRRGVDTAAQKGAVAILGPVGTREAVAAARAASLHGIPIALLAPGRRRGPGRGRVSSRRLAGDERVAVAKLALDDNFPTVGVFAPRDDVGQDAADAFVAEANALGVARHRAGHVRSDRRQPRARRQAVLESDPGEEPDLAEHLRKNPKTAGRRSRRRAVHAALRARSLRPRRDRRRVLCRTSASSCARARSPIPTSLQRKHGGRSRRSCSSSAARLASPELADARRCGGAGRVDRRRVRRRGGGDLAPRSMQRFQQKTGTPRAAPLPKRTTRDARRATRGLPPAAADPRAAFRSALARGKLDDGACGPAAIETDGELVRTPLILEVQGDELVAAP
jgi:hypothetical protein